MLSNGRQTTHALFFGLGDPKSTDFCLAGLGASPKSMDFFTMFPYPPPFSLLPPALPTIPWPPAPLSCAVRIPQLATSLADGAGRKMVVPCVSSGSARVGERLDYPSRFLELSGPAGQGGGHGDATLVRFGDHCGGRSSFSVDNLLGSRTSLAHFGSGHASTGQHDHPPRMESRDTSQLRDSVDREDSGRVQRWCLSVMISHFITKLS